MMEIASRKPHCKIAEEKIKPATSKRQEENYRQPE
jgi:hypothetical protein